MNKEVDEVDEVYQFATLEMREQVDHECWDQFSNLRACSSEDAREGKTSLQAIDAQLVTKNDEMATYSVTHDLEFLHRPKRH